MGSVIDIVSPACSWRLGACLLAGFPTAYQLDFTTPGICPSKESFRKQIRHMSNFLR